MKKRLVRAVGVPLAALVGVPLAVPLGYRVGVAWSGWRRPAGQVQGHGYDALDVALPHVVAATVGLWAVPVLLVALLLGGRWRFGGAVVATALLAVPVATWLGLRVAGAAPFDPAAELVDGVLTAALFVVVLWGGLAVFVVWWACRPARVRARRSG